MIGPAIKWKLSTLPLSLGTDAINGGIYPNVAPESSPYPKIVYQVISHPRVKSLAGYSGLASPRVQIDIYALSYADADRIANLLVQSGGLDDAAELPGVWNGVAVQACRIISQRDFYYPPEAAEGTGVHRISQDYHVWYREK